MHGHDHIVTDPDILCVKPGIKGSRLSVEFLPGLPNQPPGVAGWFVSVGANIVCAAAPCPEPCTEPTPPCCRR